MNKEIYQLPISLKQFGKIHEEMSVSQILQCLREIIQVIPTNLPPNIAIERYLLPLMRKHDPITAGHMQRVGEIAFLFAINFGRYNPQYALTPDELINLYNAARLHDIGKLGIPTSILQTTNEIREKRKRMNLAHIFYGYWFLSKIPSLNHLAPIIACHHEYWNGNGYPYGLKKEQIPFLAQIITLADIFDAIVGYRTYSPAQPPATAYQVIDQLNTRFFNPLLLEVLDQGVLLNL